MIDMIEGFNLDINKCSISFRSKVLLEQMFALRPKGFFREGGGGNFLDSKEEAKPLNHSKKKAAEILKRPPQKTLFESMVPTPSCGRPRIFAFYHITNKFSKQTGAMAQW